MTQQSDDAERAIDRDALAAWASADATDVTMKSTIFSLKNNSLGLFWTDLGAVWRQFDAHSIFYDETLTRFDVASGGYGADGATAPDAANAYQPFLSHKVAVQLLLGVLVYLEKEDGGA